VTVQSEAKIAPDDTTRVSRTQAAKLRPQLLEQTVYRSFADALPPDHVKDQDSSDRQRLNSSVFNESDDQHRTQLLIEILNNDSIMKRLEALAKLDQFKKMPPAKQ